MADNLTAPTPSGDVESLIEVVARAVFDAANDDFREHEGQLGPVPVFEWEKMSEEQREFSRRMARGAIAAITSHDTAILLRRRTEALSRLLSWWPEGSENGRAAHTYEGGFRDDVLNARAALKEGAE